MGKRISPERTWPLSRPAHKIDVGEPPRVRFFWTPSPVPGRPSSPGVFPHFIIKFFDNIRENLIFREVAGEKIDPGSANMRVNRPLFPRTRAPAAALLMALLLACGCGTNTDEPVFPTSLYTFIGPPTIIGITPVEVIQPYLTVRYEFDLQYYVTNSEEGFQGYNLYMRTFRTAAEDIVAGIEGDPYLPEGIMPSFSHVGESPDTRNPVTRRISNLTPPPGEQAFETCEKYFFSMTAVVRTNVESRRGPEVEACATLNPLLECPVGTVCNP